MKDVLLVIVRPSSVMDALTNACSLVKRKSTVSLPPVDNRVKLEDITLFLSEMRVVEEFTDIEFTRPLVLTVIL